jgi:hypothetical protein
MTNVPASLPERLADAEGDAETRKLLSELEHELGVKGASAVFRKALAIAKASRAALAHPATAEET